MSGEGQRGRGERGPEERDGKKDDEGGPRGIDEEVGVVENETRKASQRGDRVGALGRKEERIAVSGDLRN